MEPSENTENIDGEWNNVGKSRGKKQKKKLKNARTITLQTFMSENNGGNYDGVFGSPTSAGENFRDDLVGPDLSEDEQVVKSSLLSFFSDLLRRLGPVKTDE